MILIDLSEWVINGFIGALTLVLLIIASFMFLMLISVINQWRDSK